MEDEGSGVSADGRIDKGRRVRYNKRRKRRRFFVMKKIVLAFLIVLIAVCSFGCIRTTGHYRTTMCISNQTNTSFSMQYDSLDGEKTYTFDVDAGTVLDVKFVTEKGTLTCVVTDKKGKEYYRNDEVQTEDLTIKLDDKGTYSVAITAKKHKGSFSFSW